jgi:hypothetical protein
MNPTQRLAQNLADDYEVTPDLSAAADMILRNTHDQIYQPRIGAVAEMQAGPDEERPNWHRSR